MTILLYTMSFHHPTMALKGEVIEKIAALLTVAFGLVAALAWNGTIQALFKAVFGDAESLPAMLVYAVVVTIIAVVVTIWIGRLSEKAKG
ncbi:MAG: hypothetical protein GX097_04220 [Methanomicrobiales archaeon]|nr:hypothetical protein [Methanomicrobiales archaeon]